jgi:hypothetical protein
MYIEDKEEIVRYANKPSTWHSIELSIDGATEVIGFSERLTNRVLANSVYYLDSPIVDRASFGEDELDAPIEYDGENKILTLANGRVSVRFGKTAKTMKAEMGL